MENARTSLESGAREAAESFLSLYPPMALSIMTHATLALLLFLVISVHCDPPHSCDLPTQSFPFCQTSLPISQRVDDLISRLTLDEKILQLGDRAPAIPRLGVSAFSWWSEALHGVSAHGRGISFSGPIRGATSFPQVILTAASFNPQLWYRIGQAIGSEARAFYNAGQANGMTFWAPNINIFRDPRWGRGQETPGEDPVTDSKYAVYYVRGLQGEAYEGGGLSTLQASACCKHFTAYDLENWKGIQRYTFDAQVSAQDLADTYQPPFRSCVEEGHASGIMCSYNRVNGVPTCANKNFLVDTARGSWGFNGYIVSDCDAVSIIHDAYGYAKTPEDAAADVLQAGLDLNCGTYLQNHTGSAIQQRKLAESDIDRALHNLFSIRMRLGLFDGSPRYLQFGNIEPAQVCSPTHLELALVAALDGLVLLKNTGNTLPLSRTTVSSLAIIGPNANNVTLLLGNYEGPPCRNITPLASLQDYVKDTRYISGCDSAICDSASIGETVNLASSVDHVILFMGLNQNIEKEKLDRVDLVLPGMQQNLITSVSKASKRPVILVLLCGGPVDITFAKNDPTIGAILWAGYPGEAGGLAISSIIFGEHNPGGRLPVTWYPQDFTRVPMTDMRMRPDPASGYPGRTYRFYTGPTVFEFGYGLSYSTFSYKFVSVNAKPFYVNSSASLHASNTNKQVSSYDVQSIGHDACEEMKFSTIVGVQNNGPMAGRHSVLLFLKRNNAKSGSPAKELIAFESIHLNSGDGTEVEFALKPCEQLGRAETDGSKVLDTGSHSFLVGDEELEFTLLV